MGMETEYFNTLGGSQEEAKKRFEADIGESKSLDKLIEYWEKHLGEDDPLNPPNILGEVIQETLWYLKRLKELGKPGRLLNDEEIEKWAEWFVSQPSGFILNDGLKQFAQAQLDQRGE